MQGTDENSNLSRPSSAAPLTPSAFFPRQKRSIGFQDVQGLGKCRGLRSWGLGIDQTNNK